MGEKPSAMEPAKAALRKQVRGRLELMPSASRAEHSAKARELLRRQGVWQQARSVLFFAPVRGELDVWPLLVEALATRKEALLPRFDHESLHYTICSVRDLERDLETGQFGIPEPGAHCPPFSRNRLDLLLVPGVAFDLSGCRLGRGKGYYDRLLADLFGTRCGVAFDEQIVGEVPVALHDERVNCILTPTRWIEVREAPRF